MKKNNFFKIILIILLSACSVTASEKIPPKEYTQWLSELKKEMASRGISQKTLDSAFAKNYYHPKHDVVKKDRNQTEFVLKTSEYLHRVVSQTRIKQGQKHYQKLLKKYPQGVFGVPLHYLVAFWGIETNFGMYKGGYNAIEALTVLSYDTRRPKFFRKELYHALKILDEEHIDLAHMESSWAGAMGHFQFMPSTFASYGVDSDNDGKIRIWDNFDDAIASAGNYLSKIGWKEEEPWGMPIEVSWDFDYSLTGRHHHKTVKEWKETGVIVSGAKDDWRGSVIVPEGHRGQAYLIFDNFHIIMQWNKSENYALAVGLLADSIKQGKKSLTIKQADSYRLTRDDIKKVQQFAKQKKLADIEVDGALGGKTRRAVQKIQKKFHLPADGYPDYRLLKDIQNYSKNGWYPPIPTQKLHR